jgi:hypothetical protein
MRVGALVENVVFGVLWFSWKLGTWLGLADDGRAFGPGTPLVMPDEFAPVVPVPMPEAPAEEAEEPEPPPAQWVGHARSNTLHRPSCRYAPSPELAQPFSDRSSAEKAGFRVCKVCSST